MKSEPSNVSKATFLQYYDLAVNAKAVLDSASGKYRNVLKQAKAAGLNQAVLKEAMSLSNQDRDRREADHRDRMRYMAWLDRALGPVGTQGDLGLADDPEPEYESDDDKAAVEAHLLSQAGIEGFQAGRMGANIASCPYEVGSEHHQTYVSSWHAAQKEIADGMGPARRGRPRKPVEQPAEAEA